MRCSVLVMMALACAPLAQATEFPVGAFAAHWKKGGTVDPAIIDLVALGFQSGQRVRLTQIGGMRFSSSLPENEGFLFGVFSSSAELLPNGGANHRVPGALSTCAVYDTNPHSLVDIPEDFVISRVIFRSGRQEDRYHTDIVIPDGATHLFVSAGDNSYSDNIDQGLGIDVSLAPEPDVLVSIVDADGVPIDGSLLGIDADLVAGEEWYANGEAVPLEDGCSYAVTVLPGINGAAQTPFRRSDGLYREGTWTQIQQEELPFEWEMVDVELLAPDQDGAPSPGTLVSLMASGTLPPFADGSGLLRRELPASVRLPVNDDDAHHGAWSQAGGGYDFTVQPGYVGLPQQGTMHAGMDQTSLFQRDGLQDANSEPRLVHTDTDSLSFPWPQYSCAFSVVGPEGPLSADAIVLPAALDAVRSGARLPSLVSGYGAPSEGGYASGYPLTLTPPGGLASTVSIGIDAAGDAVPSHVTIEGSEYAISCESATAPRCSDRNVGIRLGASVQLDIDVEEDDDQSWSLVLSPDTTSAALLNAAGQGDGTSTFEWTPTEPGRTDFLATVTDEAGHSGTCAIVIDVAPAPELIVTGLDGTQTLLEAGQDVVVSVSLSTVPTDAVTVPVSVSDPTEGSVSVVSLQFGPRELGPLSITVSSVDDDLVDGDIDWTVTLGAPVTSDGGFSALAPVVLPMTTVDDDAVSVLLSATSLSVAESGTQASYTVTLSAEPSADVVITPNSEDATEGSVSGALTFTAQNWAVAQTVLVTGVDDALDDGDITWDVSHTISSSDGLYAALTVPSVAVTTVDDDVSDVASLPVTALLTTEAGGEDTLFVSLSAEPTAPVVLRLSSSDTTEATVFPATLTFDASNWQLLQGATVTGVDDSLFDGPVDFDIAVRVESVDAGYSAVSDILIPGVNADNDTPGLGMAPVDGVETTEAGGQDGFEVWLLSQPSAAVEIAFLSDTPGEGDIVGEPLVFTADNWDVVQYVTVEGVDDDEVDGDVDYEVFVDSVVSDDTDYDALSVEQSVACTNLDDDSVDTGLDPSDTGPLDTGNADIVERECGCSGVGQRPVGLLLPLLGLFFVRRRR